MSERKGANEEKAPLQFLAGSDFEWTGLKPDKERIDLAPNTPSQLINMRFKSGRLEGRGGQTLIVSHTKPITGMIDFFTEVEGGNGPSFPIPPMMLVGRLGGVGEIRENNYIDHISGTVQGMIAVSKDFDGNWIFGKNESASAASLRQATGDAWASAYTSLWTVPNGTFGGVFKRITSIVDDGSIALIGATQQASGFGTEMSVIYSWDGAAFSLETYHNSYILDSISMSDGTFVVYTVYDGTPNVPLNILKRAVGGAWTAYTVPVANAIFTPGQYTLPADLVGYSDPCEFGGSSYFVHMDRIIKFDGSTVSALDYVTTGIDAREASAVNTPLVFSCFSTDDALYYVWGRTTGGAINPAGLTELKIGRFNGTTWNPNYKDILAQSDLAMTGQDILGTPSIIDGKVFIGVTPAVGAGIREFSAIGASVDAISGTWTRYTWETVSDPGILTSGNMGRAITI